MKKIFILLLCFSLFINNSLLVLADDDEDKELFVDGSEINAITDYSTYGAADVTEMSSANYMTKNQFSDVKDSELLRRLSLLSDLGIINGTDGGKFSPDSDFTRIQFILTALRMMNFDADSFSGNSVRFYDLPSDYTYLCEVEAAVNLGIITGFSDKTLKPDAPISYTDALTIMLKVMGYTEEAYGRGGYPNGFLQIAKNLKLNNGLKLKDGTFTRADAAMFLYNCLHAEVFSALSLGDSGSQVYSEGTMLEAYFDIYKTTGKIESTYLAYLGGIGESEEDSVVIGGEKYTCGRYFYSEYLGKCADVYYTKDGASQKTIRSLALVGDEKELIINSEDIIGYDDYTLRYYDGKTTKTAHIAKGHNLVYNGKRKTSYGKDIFVPKNGFVRLLCTCDSSANQYDVAFVNEYFNFHVKSLSANGSILSFKPKGNSNGIIVDLAKTDFLMEIYDKGGMMASDLSVVDAYDNDGNKIKKYLVPPIPANSLLSIFTDDVAEGINGRKTIGANATYMKIYINSGKLEGTVKSHNLKNSKITIEDKQAKISDDNFLFGDNPVKVGSTGTFLFDFNGKIAAYDSSSNGEKFEYGYLVQIHGDNKLDPTYRFRLMKTNGYIEVFECADLSRFKINGEKVRDANTLEAKLEQSAKMLDSTFTISQVIKYKLNSENKISEIQTVTAPTGVADGYEKDQLNRHAPRASYTTPRYFGGALFSADGDIVVQGRKLPRYAKCEFYFVVPDSETFDEDDYLVKPNTHFFSDAIKADLFNCDDGLSPDVAVLYSKTELAENDPPFIVVDQKIKMLDEDGVEVTAVTGLDGYRESNFIEDEPGVFDSAVQGDIYFCKGSSKRIKQAEKLFSVYAVADHDYDSTEYIAKAISGDTETMYATPMEVYEYNTSTRSFVLQIGADDDGDGKRDLQRVEYWSDLSSTFRYGCVTCNIYERNITLKAGNANDIRTAKEFGHADSTKIMFVESSNLRFFVLINDYR